MSPADLEWKTKRSNGDVSTVVHPKGCPVSSTTQCQVLPKKKRLRAFQGNLCHAWHRVGNCINHPGTTDRNRKTDSRTVGDGRGMATTEMKTLLNVLGKTHMGGWRGQGHNDSDLLSNMCLRVKSKSKKEGEIG